MNITLQLFSKANAYDAYHLLRNPKELLAILKLFGVAYIAEYFGWDWLSGAVYAGVAWLLISAAWSNGYKNVTSDGTLWFNLPACIIGTFIGWGLHGLLNWAYTGLFNG